MFHDEPTDTQPLPRSRTSDCPAITDIDVAAIVAAVGYPSAPGAGHAISLDALTAQLTGFPDFAFMVVDPGGVSSYRPSIYPDSPEHVRLADAYDAAQHARGDSRRAYRGGA